MERRAPTRLNNPLQMFEFPQRDVRRQLRLDFDNSRGDTSHDKST
jgi:hypothetical protein